MHIKYTFPLKRKSEHVHAKEPLRIGPRLRDTFCTQMGQQKQNISRQLCNDGLAKEPFPASAESSCTQDVAISTSVSDQKL